MKDDGLILNSMKELTRRIRPCCDIDGLPVGAVWYQLKKNNQQDKIITDEMKGVLRGNMVVCISCYFNLAFPPHLSSSDFEKCDILMLTSGAVPADRWTNEEYILLMDSIRESGGNDWGSVFKKFTNKREEEVILKFLKLPFINLSNIFLLEEKHTLDKMGSNPEAGFSDTKGVVNPLEPHFGIFKDFLNQFKSNKNKMKCEPTIKKNRAEEIKAFKALVNTQLDIISDRINYLEEFEEIVVHEKKQMEQYNKRISQSRFKQNLQKNSQYHASSSTGIKQSQSIKNELTL